LTIHCFIFGQVIPVLYVRLDDVSFVGSESVILRNKCQVRAFFNSNLEQFLWHLCLLALLEGFTEQILSFWSELLLMPM
jgi:hypothetical protein